MTPYRQSTSGWFMARTAPRAILRRSWRRSSVVSRSNIAAHRLAAGKVVFDGAGDFEQVLDPPSGPAEQFARGDATVRVSDPGVEVAEPLFGHGDRGVDRCRLDVHGYQPSPSMESSELMISSLHQRATSRSGVSPWTQPPSGR